VDSVWEQEKPKARKMPVSRDESHQSAARCVGRQWGGLILRINPPVLLGFVNIDLPIVVAV